MYTAFHVPVSYTHLAEVRNGLIFAVILAVLIQSLLVIVGYLCGKTLHMDSVEKGSVVYSNAANLIIPIVSSVLGEEWVVYTSAFVSVQLVFIWTHGISLFSDNEKFNWKKIVFNINIIAIFIGILMLITGIRLPAMINEVTASFGDMIGPLAMLINGMLIAGMDFRQVIFQKRIYLVMLFRMVVCPAIVLVLIKLFHAESMIINGEEIVLVVFLATMTPAASMITQFAQLHNKGGGYAGAINIMTTLACMITMPIFVFLYEMI